MKALFCIANEYNQSEHNLKAIFQEQPSIELLTKTMGWDFPNENDEVTVAIVNLWIGKHVKINFDTYRLEDIKFNERI